jgi:hypothetical protein
MIHYRTQQKNDVNDLTVDVSLDHQPKTYRIYWPTNHSGMFLQYLIGMHNNFPQSSAAYITLPTKKHVIYKTEEDIQALIGPVYNEHFTKWIDSDIRGHDLKDIDIDSADVIMSVTPEVKMAQQRNSISTIEWEHNYAKILVDLASNKHVRDKVKFISITRLLNKDTRQEEYKHIVNIIEEEPLSRYTLDSLCNEYIKHIGYTDV